jgi:predicted nucleic acid-binding protein
LAYDEARAAIAWLSRLIVIPIDTDMVLAAIELGHSASIAYWDALIVGAAASAGCRRVLTEDLNHGQIIDGVRVENPFIKG